MATSSTGQQATDSLNGKLTFEQDKNRIVGRDENNFIRLLVLADGTDFVMKIAPEGFDATTATDDQLIYNSNNNIPKFVETGTFSFVPADFVNTGNSYLTKYATYDIVHPSGVLDPVVWVFMEDALGRRTQLPYPVFNNNTGALSYIAIQYMDTVSTTVEVRSTIALSPGVQFRYYILQETAKGS
jgi:hypothetical protein